MSSPIEAAAQKFIFAPEHTQAIGDQLGSELRVPYAASGMLDRLPAKANLLITQGQRVAEWAALWHVITSQLIRTTLPKLRRGESILPEGTSNERGPYHAFMDAGSMLLGEASATVLADTSPTGWGRYKPLWDQIGTRQEQYRERWRERKQELEDMGAVVAPTPPVEPGGQDDIDAIWEGSGKEITKSVLWALVSKRHSDPLGNVRSSKELARRTMAATAIMNRGTTMKRALNLKLFPNLFTDLPEHLEASFFLPERGTAFTDDGTTCKWAHTMLNSDSPVAPGRCAGRIWLWPDELRDARSSEELFVIGEAYAQAPILRPGNGIYNGGLATLVIDSFMTPETIYSPEATL